MIFIVGIVVGGLVYLVAQRLPYLRLASDRDHADSFIHNLLNV